MKSGRLTRHRPAGPGLVFDWNPEQMPLQPAVGGWAEVSHPRGNTTVEWQGRPLRTVSFPLLLQTQRTGQVGTGPAPDRLGSVESDVALLTSWGQPLPPLGEPPVLRLDYGPAESGLYVLQGLKPTGVERRRANDLARWLVEFEVELVEWREPQVLLTPAQQVAARPLPTGTPRPSGRTYTVRAGDTLVAIAARLLGSSTRWQELGRLNGVRDPRKLRIGQVLRLP